MSILLGMALQNTVQAWFCMEVCNSNNLAMLMHKQEDLFQKRLDNIFGFQLLLTGVYASATKKQAV